MVGGRVLRVRQQWNQPEGQEAEAERVDLAEIYDTFDHSSRRQEQKDRHRLREEQRVAVAEPHKEHEERIQHNAPVIEAAAIQAPK